MAFIEPDDYIILFDLPNHATAVGGHQIPLDAMERLREVGVKTVLQQLSWRQIEKKFGHRDWTEIDGFVAKARASNMKTLLLTYDLALSCGPLEWYLRGGGGRTFRNFEQTGYSLLSLWNEEAMAYAEGFIRETCERYSAPDVCCISALQREAEWVLPPKERAFFDESAVAHFRNWAQVKYRDDLSELNQANRCSHSHWRDVRPLGALERDTVEWVRESVVRYVVRQQQLFAPYHQEVWGMLQHSFEWDAGNFCSDAIYQGTREHVDAGLYNIQFEYFPHGEAVKRKVVSDARRYDMPTFVGSGWPEGLAPHTPLAIAQGLRGFITAPLHPYNGHREVAPWMIEAFRASINQWIEGAIRGPRGERGLGAERIRMPLRAVK